MNLLLTHKSKTIGSIDAALRSNIFCKFGIFSFVRWFRDPILSSPVQHIGLSVPICSKLFNNDSAIPEMVRMVRKESGNGKEMSGNGQEMVMKCQEMSGNR